jgi:hypothetical protein
MTTVKYDGRYGDVLNIDGRTFESGRTYQFSSESLLPRPIKELKSIGLEISDSDEISGAVVDWVDVAETIPEEVVQTEVTSLRGGVTLGSPTPEKPIETIVSVRGGVSAT